IHCRPAASERVDLTGGLIHDAVDRPAVSRRLDLRNGPAAHVEHRRPPLSALEAAKTGGSARRGVLGRDSRGAWVADGALCGAAGGCGEPELPNWGCRLCEATELDDEPDGRPVTSSPDQADNRWLFG